MKPLGVQEEAVRTFPATARGLTDSLPVCETHSMVGEDIRQALAVLGLTLPVTREVLEQKRRELLHTWHPHRYANLTNNPKKYMQMFKQAEGMTKKVEAAYSLLSDRLKSFSE